ncbi:hypothetical protein Ancab_001236 [Ancistrocladus abbreviatus]
MLALTSPVMLGILCARPPKPWILSSLSLSHHYHHHHHGSSTNNRFLTGPVHFEGRRRLYHHQNYSAFSDGLSRAVSVWHANANANAIVPAAAGNGDWRRDYLLPAFLHHHHEQKGEGSWNVAWDARPARWIHRLDLAWLLFGVCACLAPIEWVEVNPEVVVAEDEEEGEEKKKVENCESDGVSTEKSDDSSVNYRVTGVPADGRCLFRAIAHGACLQSGEEAPDENRQRELADDLRARVVEELLKRREETEWFIEGDFDAYVKRIQQPYVWGGEPELLMASHVLKTPISVYMKDRSSGILTNIANYGEEYQKEKDWPINVLFHGYGHYDILETSSNQICQKEISV